MHRLPVGPGEESPPLIRSRLVFLSTALAVLIADIVTKRIVVATMSLHEVKRVFGDYARLTYIHNPGAAFGLFPGSRWPLIGISIAAIIVVLVVAWRRQTRYSTLIPLGLILGGAIGNLIDRLRLGEVVDFIQIGIPPHYWPVFNVADSAVSIGVVWLAIGLMASGEPKPEESLDALAPSRDDG